MNISFMSTIPSQHSSNSSLYTNMASYNAGGGSACWHNWRTKLHDTAVKTRNIQGRSMRIGPERGRQIPANKSARMLPCSSRSHHSRDGVLLPAAISTCELYLWPLAATHLQHRGLKLSSRSDGLARSSTLLLLLEPCPRGALELWYYSSYMLVQFCASRLRRYLDVQGVQ